MAKDEFQLLILLRPHLKDWGRRRSLTTPSLTEHWGLHPELGIAWGNTPPTYSSHAVARLGWSTSQDELYGRWITAHSIKLCTHKEKHRKHRGYAIRPSGSPKSLKLPVPQFPHLYKMVAVVFDWQLPRR